MSLTEILVSLACNFIVAGVVWDLRGSNAGLICLGIGLILLILAYLVRKKRSRPEPTQSQHNEQRVEANPQQNVYISSDVLRGHTPQPLPPQQPKPCPELELIDWKPTMIGYERTWVELNVARLRLVEWKPNAFVAIFRNRPAPPGEETIPAYGATAHLIYRNQMDEQQIVNYGTWLQKYEHFADFDSATSHALVLSSSVRAGKEADGKSYVFDNHNQFNIFKVPYAASGRVIHAPEEKLLLDECSEVEVSIVSRNVTLYHGTFRRVLNSSGLASWVPAD